MAQLLHQIFQNTSLTMTSSMNYSTVFAKNAPAKQSLFNLWKILVGTSGNQTDLEVLDFSKASFEIAA